MAVKTDVVARGVRATSTRRTRPRALTNRSGFWAVAFAFFAVTCYAAVPTPLYRLYGERDGFASMTITLVFAAYALGVIVSLISVGHLSDQYGRRRLLIPALLTSAASAMVFLLWEALPGLVVGRFLSGLAIGAVTATATAWLAELHAVDRPADNPHRAEIVGISANLGGVGFGPLVAGALAQWVPSPLTVPHLAFASLLVLAVPGVLLTPETRTPDAQHRQAYRLQRLRVPAGPRAPFLSALGAAFIALAALGMFVSLAPTFLAGSLDHPSLALAGAGAFIAFAGAVVAQVALVGRRHRHLVLTGSVGVITGSVSIVVAVWLRAPSLTLFLVGGALLGVGAGALFKGAVATTMALAEPNHRAETLVTLFVSAYLGVAIPPVGLGLLLERVDAESALLVFGSLLIAGVIASVKPLLTPTRADAPASPREPLSGAGRAPGSSAVPRRTTSTSSGCGATPASSRGCASGGCRMATA